MIDFIYSNDSLILKYSPIGGVEWIKKDFKEKEFVIIKKTFIFESSDVILYSNDNSMVQLRLGTLENDYYKISKEKLNCDMDIYFYKKLKLKFEHFLYPHAGYMIDNNFKIMSEVMKKTTDLYIGGNINGDIERDYTKISFEDYNDIINSFPKDYEKTLYAKSRIYQSVENYFENTIDYTEKLENYRNKHNSTIVNRSINELRKNELEKYDCILKKLKYMYKNKDKYSEKQWQNEIAQIILLIFPKYIDYVEKVRIPIQDSNKKYEEFDMLLVTASGNIDILEIKKPQTANIVSNSTDRDNYYSTNFLSKTVMQLEKYIYHLNSLGYDANSKLSKNPKFEKIVDIVEVKAMNPKGIAILGDEEKLNARQKRDLEIIRKMYSNIVEIITYDDLIKRVQNTLKSIEKRC